MAKASLVPAWQRALIILTSTVIGAILVSCLYWAQKIFIPIALAVFLTFLLAPLVTILQRRGLGRTPSAILVVLLAVLVLGGVGWLVMNEVASLGADIPTYTKNINGKIRSLRQMSEGSVMERLGKMLQDIAGEWEAQPAGSKEKDADPLSGSGAVAAARPVVVVPQPEGSAFLSRVPALLRPAVESLGGVGLALVLVVFMLLRREDLRNRLIRLVGDGRMTVMTKAVDDAGRRISRFLVMQLIVNGGFGLALSLGLLAVQVPHALVWGLLAAMLRYIPYLGSWIMAALLITLSLALFPGWVQPLLILGLIVVLELVTANVIEPRLFGHSMGISEVGLLVAAAFWIFLWGPIGLVLSSPLTVCLVVLGKYVPHLEFLDVLLGNEQVMDPGVSYYQRLLARDQDEATQLVLAQAKTSSPEQVYDGILVPALNYLKRDRAQDDLTDADEQFVLGATREIIEDLGERQAAAVELATVLPEGSATLAPRKVRVLGYPGHDETDRLGLEMFRQLLDPAHWDVEVLSIDMLSAEMIALAGDKEPAIVCIGAMPPGGLAHTRYLCKRLRARLPNAKIVVGRWGLRGNLEQNHEQLREAGADQVEMSLLETRNHLQAWLPVLTQASGTKASEDSRLTNTVGCASGVGNGRSLVERVSSLRRLKMSELKERIDGTARTVKGMADKGCDQALAATQAVGNWTKDATSGAIGAVKEKVHDVADGASDLIDRATDKAEEWASSVGDAVVHAEYQARQAASATADKANDLAKEVTCLIRRYPIPALLVGVGAGFLLGQVLHQSSSRRA